MKKVLWFTLFFSFVSMALDQKQIREFIVSSLDEKNVLQFGFQSLNEVKRFTVGPLLEVREVDNDSLRNYPASGFSVAGNLRYAPILVDGEVRCFAVIDESGQAVAMGYKVLAEDLNDLSRQFGLPIEEILLYSSRQINAFLVSIPEKAVAAAFGNHSVAREKNLMVLDQNWREALLPLPLSGGAAEQLSSEAETISRIRMTGGIQ